MKSPPGKNVFATIFIPTGNRSKSLHIVLRSLTKQTYQNFEVIIVDYKSTDDTHTVIDSFRKKIRITLVHQKIKGLSKAANLALRKTKGVIFIRTDDDVLMEPGWLKAIHDLFESDKHIGGVTGPTVIPKQYKQFRDLFIVEQKFRKGGVFWRLMGRLYFNYFMEGTPRRVSHWFDSGAFGLGTNFEDSARQPLQEATNLEACNFSVRTALLKTVGGFDSAYTGVGEYHEADAALKIREWGYKLMFSPKVYLSHHPSQDGFFKERAESYGRMANFMLFYLRHIKPNTFRKASRFISYTVFLNCYYVFTAIKLRQLKQLGAATGTLGGIVRYFRLK